MLPITVKMWVRATELDSGSLVSVKINLEAMGVLTVIWSFII